MKELLRNALRLADVDYCEIRFEQSEFLSIGYQGKELDRIVRDTPYGGNVRALYKGGWGFASFNSLDDLDEAVKSACRQARITGDKQGGESKLAPAPIIEDEYVPNYTLDPRKVSLDEKINLLDRYRDIILGYDPAITAAQITYNERVTDLCFANTEGTYVRQEKLDIGASLGATCLLYTSRCV